MEGLTQVSVLILVGVCLAAIPMAVAVKALERLIQHGGSPAIAASAGNTPTGDLDEEISRYISSQKPTRAIRYLLAAGLLTLTWAAFGCLVAVLVVTL